METHLFNVRFDAVCITHVYHQMKTNEFFKIKNNTQKLLIEGERQSLSTEKKITHFLLRLNLECHSKKCANE